MRRTTSRFRLLAAGVSLAFLAVACGGTADQEDAGPPPDALDAPRDDAGDADHADDGALVFNNQVIASAELLAAAQAEGQLILYTGHFEEAEIATAAEFTKDTGVEVEVVRLPGGRLDERILTEAGAGELQMDVVHQSDPTTNLNYFAEGLIEPHELPESIREQIPDEWVHPDNLYYSTYISTMGIAYNNQLVSEEDAPKGFMDLLDPRWENQIIMPFAGIGGSGWAMALFQRQVVGEDYWERLAAQNPTIGQSAAGIAEEVARGEFPITINAITTTLGAVRGGAPITVVFPEEGVPTFPYALSVASNGPNPNAARLYMNWRNSLRGLSFGVEIFGTYVGHPDAPAPMGVDNVRLPSFTEIKPWAPDADSWVNLREPWVAEWNAIYNFSRD